MRNIIALGKFIRKLKDLLIGSCRACQRVRVPTCTQTREIPKGYSKGLGVLAIGFVSTAELVARCLCVLASEKDLHVLVDKLQAVIWLQ